MMKSFIRGDEEICLFLAKMYQQEGAETASWGTMDAATLEYILKAVAFVSLGEDIKLHISERNYTTDALEVIRLGQEIVYQHLNLDIFGTEGMLLGIWQETKEVEEAEQPVGVAAYVLKEGFDVDLAHLERQLKLIMPQESDY